MALSIHLLALTTEVNIQLFSEQKSEFGSIKENCCFN